MATHREEIANLSERINQMLLYKTTEATALSESTSYPKRVYYTTDTHEIIVNGVSYGKPLPVADTNTLGGVKVGTGLQMGEADHLEVKQATSSEIGGVMLQGMNTTSDDDKKAYSVAYIEENVKTPLSQKADKTELNDYVTKATDQTVSGVKTFSGGATYMNKVVAYGAPSGIYQKADNVLTLDLAAKQHRHVAIYTHIALGGYTMFCVEIDGWAYDDGASVHTRVGGYFYGAAGNLYQYEYEEMGAMSWAGVYLFTYDDNGTERLAIGLERGASRNYMSAKVNIFSTNGSIWNNSYRAWTFAYDNLDYATTTTGRVIPPVGTDRCVAVPKKTISIFTGTSGQVMLGDGSLADKREDIKSDFYQMPTNPFGGSRRAIQQNTINNTLYAADWRYNVTLTGFTNAIAWSLFDGNYETSKVITKGGTGTILIESTDGDITPTLPYGYIFLSFYWKNLPESASARVYGRGGGSTTMAWHDLTSSVYFTDNNTYNHCIALRNVNFYNLTKIEITVNARADIDCYLTQVEHCGERSALKDMSVVTKNAITQDLWGDVVAPKFIVRGGTSSQFLKANGDVDSTTYAVKSTVDSSISTLTTSVGQKMNKGITVNSDASTYRAVDSLTFKDGTNTTVEYDSGIKVNVADAAVGVKGVIKMSGASPTTAQLGNYGLIAEYGGSAVAAPVTASNGGVMTPSMLSALTALTQVMTCDDIILKFVITSVSGSQYNYTNDPWVWDSEGYDKDPTTLLNDIALGASLSVKVIIDLRSVGSVVSIGQPLVWEGRLVSSSTGDFYVRCTNAGTVSGGTMSNIPSFRVETTQTDFVLVRQ